MTQPDSEFVYQIKQKVEALLKILIEEYDLEQIISKDFKYKIDFGEMQNSKYYKLYEDKRNVDGLQYNYGYDYIPEGFQDWLWCNFPDFMHTEEIYDILCRTGFITQTSLRFLNNIYKKHPPKTA